MAILQQKTFNGYSDTTMTVGSYEKLLVQFEKLVDEALEKTSNNEEDLSTLATRNQRTPCFVDAQSP